MSYLTAQLFDPDFIHRGPLPVTGGELVLRNNDISTFRIDINTVSKQWEEIRSQYGDIKDWHIRLTDNHEGQTRLMEGVIVNDREGYEGIPTYQISGLCHLDYLDGRITLPDPSRAADKQDIEAYYKDKGPAAEVIFQLVRKLVAQGARPEFQTPMRVSSTWADKPGKTVSVNSRFKPLLEVVQDLAKAGGITFGSRMTETGAIRFEQSVPVDRTVNVRLSEQNDTVGDWALERSRPEATMVLVAGQGEGEERTLVVRKGNKNSWGTNRIVYKDQRHTDEIDELKESGDETLQELAETASISIDLVDTEEIRFGREYGVGDLVTVQLSNGGVLQDAVQEVQLTYTGEGREGRITVGPTGDYAEDYEDEIVNLVKKLQSRIQSLEAR